jgi:hypothetical protein
MKTNLPSCITLCVLLFCCCLADVDQNPTWDCEALDSIKDINCNTTTKSFFMKDIPRLMNFTNCINDEFYYNRNGNLCELKSNHSEYRVRCPSHMSSSKYIEGCRIYLVIQFNETTGIFREAEYGVDVDLTLLEDKSRIYGCKKNQRYIDLPVQTSWQNVINCEDDSFNYSYETNCYNFAIFFPEKVICQVYTTVEIVFS